MLAQNGEGDARAADFVEQREKVRIKRRAEENLSAPEAAGEDFLGPPVVKKRVENGMIEQRIGVLVNEKIGEPKRQSGDEHSREDFQLVTLDRLLRFQF